ncbi:MAG: transposase [Candidatus Schekmanbacteria bacterium]|nr:transposase [Candidatus Schekmanbacteria bacterium]
MVSPWCASSKRCSVCGHILEELPLSQREWRCPTCGAQHERDLNVARNLENLTTMASSTRSNACGEGRSRQAGLRAAGSHSRK